MKDSRINYALVGGFVILMIGGLITVLALLAGRTGPTDPYHTRFANVAGIKYGTQVLYEGYLIGQVEDIVPERDGLATSFRVEMALRQGWAIPEGSAARLAASGLLSAVTIDIKAGPGPGLIPPGGMVPSDASGSMFAVLTNVASEITDLSRNSLRPLLDTIRAQVDVMGESVITRLPAILENLNQVSAELAARTPQIAAGAATFTERLNDGVLSDANLASLSRTLANAETATAQFAGLSGDLKQTSADVRSLVGVLETLGTESGPDLRAAAKDLRYTLDALARNIDSITYNLDGTSRNMMEFSRTIRQNPGLLLGGKPPVDEARPPSAGPPPAPSRQ